MSSPPPETETHEVPLSRDEQWVVHHVLVSRVDDAYDADESPPTWALEALETVEAIDSDEQSETFTGRQTRELATLLEIYLDGDVPERDAVHGSTVYDRLEATLESPA
ncbi:hypothetical protein [Natrarchaeobaculum aegyptiacum]|uniref:Uncharacterized protein n=1 Tax=Natrarchaeobaculum aegyptiacum TaxID=745377 RepID=A0A2Z2HWR3_9EURY|nr:hypothetical protein [Natrarchaeobaculum aegyptiacum]ARS91661.1 hypothetical protein B1756_03470 [Natrarchaeobaculum aegyptiacum]